MMSVGGKSGNLPDQLLELQGVASMFVGASSSAPPLADGATGAAALGRRSIPLCWLVADPENPRPSGEDSDLDELAGSLYMNGQMSPILVFQVEPDRFRIIFGHRRVDAARRLGWETIDATVIARPTPLKILILQITENDQRRDLSPIARARAYARAMEIGGLTPSEFCRQTGLRQPNVAKALGLLKLANPVRDLVDSGRLHWSSAYPLRRLGLAEQADVAARAVENNWRRDQVEAEVKSRLAGAFPGPDPDDDKDGPDEDGPDMGAFYAVSHARPEALGVVDELTGCLRDLLGEAQSAGLRFAFGRAIAALERAERWSARVR